MRNVLRVGVIGYGYWGPNLVRSFQDTPGCLVSAICDLEEQRLALAHSRHPHIRPTMDSSEIVGSPDIDLVVVATPISTHFGLTFAALSAGKHALVAKPLASKVEEAEELIALARQQNRMLLTDHTFLYTPAVRKMRELLLSGEIGEPYYYDSTRVNLGLVQSDVSVLWDLAAHDLSMLDFLFAQKPVSISARAVAHIGSRETVAYLFVRFAGSLVAHINVNWLAPRKVRLVFIGGSRKMIVYDDNEPSEKVKVYDRGVLLQGHTERSMLIEYRTGDMFAPQIGNVEALRLEAQHAVDCIRTGAEPMTGGDHALRVVRMLAAAELSLRHDGREIAL